MLGGDRDKKLVERPDEEPEFDRNNKTDKKLIQMFVLLGLVVLLLLVIVLVLYFVFK